MSAQYSRSAPSARYIELTQLYRQLHTDGDAARNLAPQKMFDGGSLIPHAPIVKALIEAHGAETILDYGSGKGRQYEPAKVTLKNGESYESVPVYWGVRSVRCYDPGYPPFSTLPEGQFDGVVCTDVLEHCPEEDIPWILEEMFGFARQFVFATVCSKPANKVLPNGENAHCAIRPLEWWDGQISEAAGKFPAVRYAVLLMTLVDDDGERRVKMTQLTNDGGVHLGFA